jgi:hypothetical protein
VNPAFVPTGVYCCTTRLILDRSLLVCDEPGRIELGRRLYSQASMLARWLECSIPLGTAASHHSFDSSLLASETCSHFKYGSTVVHNDGIGPWNHMSLCSCHPLQQCNRAGAQDVSQTEALFALSLGRGQYLPGKEILIAGGWSPGRHYHTGVFPHTRTERKSFGVLAQPLHQDWNDRDHGLIFIDPGERADVLFLGPFDLQWNIFAV